jgi:glycosyltransferase involved in cell wall biosynthesis
VSFDSRLGRPWARFDATNQEIIHSSSLLATNGRHWVLDIDHFQYLALQAGAYPESPFRDWADDFLSACVATLRDPMLLGIICWSRAAAASVRDACAPFDIEPPMTVAYPAVVLPVQQGGSADVGAPERRSTVRLLAVDGQTGVPARLGRKNIAASIAAFEVMRQRGYDVELTVVASTEEVPTRAGIRHLDALARPEMFELLRQTDILLFLSRQDGFGYVLLEAMFSGVCVIASAAPSVPVPAEIIRDGQTGFLVEYLDRRDYPALSDDLDFRRLLTLLEELVRTPEKRERVGEAARREFAGQGPFSVSRRNSTIRDFLSDQLHRRRPAGR